MVLTGLAVASVPRPPTSASAAPPWPLSPWHAAHASANNARPSATLPRPAGRPAPSPETSMFQAAISSAVTARPRLVRSAATPATEQTTISAAAAAMDLNDMGDRSLGIELPAIDRIEVIVGVQPTGADQLLLGRLQIAGGIGGAALQQRRS